jgi:hypothetical protein
MTPIHVKGQANPDRITKGGSELYRVYKGPDLVWQKKGTAPPFVGCADFYNKDMMHWFPMQDNLLFTDVVGDGSGSANANVDKESSVPDICGSGYRFLHDLDSDPKKYAIGNMAFGGETQSMTLAVWVKVHLDYVFDIAGMILRTSAGDQSLYGFALSVGETAGQLRLNLGYSHGGTTAANFYPITRGVWYRALISLDPYTDAGELWLRRRTYLNGVPFDKNRWQIPSAPQNLEYASGHIIGAYNSSGFAAVKCSLTDLKVWPFALTPDEAACDYYGGSCWYPGIEDDTDS